MKNVPSGVCRCIVTGGEVKHITELADMLRPDMVQMHGNEPLAVNAQAAAALHDMGIRMIRTIPTSREKRLLMFESDEPEGVISAAVRFGADALLIDPRECENAAGSGFAAPLEIFRTFKLLSPIPVILAGGITPGNVGKILARSGASYIDIMTGIEDAPGIKNPTKLKKLFSNIEGGFR